MSSSRRDTVNNRSRPGSWWRAWWRGKFASRALVLAISLSCVASLTVLRATDPFVVSSARETAFDLLQRMSPREYVDAPARIIDIDERSL
jgi:adenylate cyclase